MQKMKYSGVEWIGEIPEDRRIIRNKYALSFIKGKIPSEINTEQKGIPYIGASDLDTLSGNANYLLYTSDVNVPMCNSEDVLVLWDGARAGLIGKNHTGAISSTIVKITPDQFINKHFFFWYLKGFEKYLYECVNGTTIPHVNKKYVEDIMMIDWSLDDQKRIADFLDDKCGKIDRYIEKQQQTIDKLKEYKQAVITEAVTKGLNPDVPMKDSGIEWIGMIPEHWKVMRIKNLLKERNERSEDGIEEPLSMSQKLGLIPTKFMDTIPNIASSFIGAKLAYINDLVFNKLKAHLGVFSVSRYDGLVSPDYAVYYSTGLANLKYLEYTFKTPQCICEFRKKSSGIADGLTRLYTSGLFSIYVPFPCIMEQNSIAKHLETRCSEIDSAISKQTSIIEKLTEYKKSLIYEVVTGKLEV